jgi:hypothetical protein
VESSLPSFHFPDLAPGPGFDMDGIEQRRVGTAHHSSFVAAGQTVGSAHPTEQAKALFRKALEIARRQAAKTFELRAATSLARLWLRPGKPQGKRENPSSPRSTPGSPKASTRGRLRHAGSEGREGAVGGAVGAPVFCERQSLTLAPNHLDPIGPWCSTRRHDGGFASDRERCSASRR